jgi:hypothetical protein
MHNRPVLMLMLAIVSSFALPLPFLMTGSPDEIDEKGQKWPKMPSSGHPAATSLG